ncbi:hypothetical protein [Pseudoalteromonas aurantia]|uniref:Uncharacterized protein n=1 Tax=Pseudoalteromonas aurantia TaxID=43654 RepID=A0ABY2VYU2_9GAMM|nr:hypothetical protein [Pseudoalteromonas aurantia]TMO75317.1 hypothetical protein CWC20_08325 [Pseudoalteromonas aurantia]
MIINSGISISEIIEYRVCLYKKVLKDMAEQGKRFKKCDRYKTMVDDINLLDDLGCMAEFYELSELLSKCDFIEVVE